MVNQRFGSTNVKYTNLVALDNLGRRIIRIIMCLVVLVPLITGVYSVEVSWFTRTILVAPRVRTNRNWRLCVEGFLFLVKVSLHLCTVHGFRSCIFRSELGSSGRGSGLILNRFSGALAT
jgi:hypothetical protein